VLRYVKNQKYSEVYMVTFAVMPADALDLAGDLEALRKDEIYTEHIGLPDGTEISMDRCFRFPFAEYGEVKEACIGVEDNDLHLMLIFQNYRVGYALIAQNQWNSVEVEAFSGTGKKFDYDFFNRMKKEHIGELRNFFKGKLVSGRDNLYGMLGSSASDPDFLRNYLYSIVLK